jgi:hypothetical protein
LETSASGDSLANLREALDVAVREQVAGRPVYTLDGVTFSWADIVAIARLDDSWRELDEMTRQGLACQKRVAIDGEQLTAVEVLDATTRFRYLRNLLSGEELTEWLEHWELTASEWRDHVRRALLRERWTGELDDTTKRFPVGDDELGSAIRADSESTGFIVRFAQRLAGDCALAVAAGTRFDAQPETFVRIRTVAERARADAITEEAIEREVALHRLEWLRVEGEALNVTAESVAREAALSIRIDGRSLAEVAAECGTQTTPLSASVGDFDAELSSALVAAREGELIGPVPRDDGFALYLVETKTLPSPADPDARRRAEERIVERAVDRAVRDRVEWHERL